MNTGIRSSSAIVFRQINCDLDNKYWCYWGGGVGGGYRIFTGQWLLLSVASTARSLFRFIVKMMLLYKHSCTCWPHDADKKLTPHNKKVRCTVLLMQSKFLVSRVCMCVLCYFRLLNWDDNRVLQLKQNDNNYINNNTTILVLLRYERMTTGCSDYSAQKLLFCICVFFSTSSPLCFFPFPFQYLPTASSCFLTLSLYIFLPLT